MQDAEYKPSWEKGVYPSDLYLMESLENCELWVCECDNEYAAAMIVNHNCNQEYKSVEWSVDTEEDEFIVVHALCVLTTFQGKGITGAMVKKVIEIAEIQSRRRFVLMYVTETPIVTNHYLSDVEKQGTGSEQSHARFDTLSNLYQQSDGVMTVQDVQEALSAVSQSNFDNEYEETIWSIVFIPERQTAMFYYRENYQNAYVITLNDFSVSEN